MKIFRNNPLNRPMPWLIVLGMGLLILALSLTDWSKRSSPLTHHVASSRKNADSTTLTAVPVKVGTASLKDVPIILHALGTVTAYNTVTVRSQVSGEIKKIAFKEGQRVQAGDLLAQINPQTFQVQVAQAEGQKKQNQSRLEHAQRDLQRYQALSKQNSIAKQQVDAQIALVAQYKGALQSDQANLDNAKLQLAFTRVTAPISGRLGLRRIDHGNILSNSDVNGLVTITQTQPIVVLFTLAENQLPEVLAQWRAGNILPVKVYNRDETQVLEQGQLETLDNQIDPSTGTIKLKARFDNPHETLFPNQFVPLRLQVRVQRHAVVIPSQAVHLGAKGSFVFLLEHDNTVSLRPLTLGVTYGQQVVVDKGLQAGEQVVTEGFDQLRAGTKVRIASSQVIHQNGMK